MKTMDIVSVPQSAVLPALRSPKTTKLVALGERRGWEARVLGRAPLPQAAVRFGEWLIVPIEQDTSQVPARALRRVQAIYEAGLRPAGFVVVHEAPLQLAGPAPKPVQIDPAEIVERLRPLGEVAVKVAGMLVVVGVNVALALAFIAMPLPFLVIGALALDPILIAVMDDGSWVEIDRWWSEPQ